MGKGARESVEKTLQYDYRRVWKRIFDSISEGRHKPEPVPVMWQTMFEHLREGFLKALGDEPVKKNSLRIHDLEKRAAEHEKALIVHEKMLLNQDKALSEHGEMLLNQDKALSEYGKMLLNQDKVLSEQKKKTETYGNVLYDMTLLI